MNFVLYIATFAKMVDYRIYIYIGRIEKSINIYQAKLHNQFQYSIYLTFYILFMQPGSFQYLKFIKFNFIPTLIIAMQGFNQFIKSFFLQCFSTLDLFILFEERREINKISFLVILIEKEVIFSKKINLKEIQQESQSLGYQKFKEISQLSLFDQKCNENISMTKTKVYNSQAETKKVTEHHIQVIILLDYYIINKLQ